MGEPSLTVVLEAIQLVQRGLDGVREEQTRSREELAGVREEQKRSREEQKRFREELAGVREEQKRFLEELAGVREEQKRLRVDLMARMDRLQDDMSGLRDDAFVTYARVERVEKATREQIQGLAAEISGMHRQIRSLQDEVRILRGDH